MANTLKFGNGEWATKEGSTLAYNDENGNFKPLPFTFDRSTSATRVNKEGLIEVVSNNEPRIDFLNDSKGALLLEPSRSNLVKSSGDISTQSTYWLSNQGGTSIQNATTAPDGSNTASQINTFGQQYSGITQGSISVSNTEYTYSVYLKAKNGTPNIRLIFFDGVTFHSSDFTISSEWERYDYKFTPLAGSFQIYITCPYVETSFYTWGIQLEQGSYATSIIPTQGSIGTRVAETCSQTVPSNIFNSVEGVIYTEISSLSNDGTQRRFTFGNANFSNNIRFTYMPTDNVFEVNLYNGSDQGKISFTLTNATELNKIAYLYSANDFQLWINGVKVDFVNSGTTFSSGTIVRIAQGDSAGARKFYGNIKDLKVYNEKLTEQQLQALTTI